MSETRLQRSSTSIGSIVLILATLLVAQSLAVAKPADGASKRGIVVESPSGIRSVKVDGGYMVPYTEKIPGTDVSFEMIPSFQSNSS